MEEIPASCSRNENKSNEGNQEHNPQHFECGHSREEIVENRKIRRKAKRVEEKRERQKLRDQKLIEDRLRQGRSEKVKLVEEEFVKKYKDNLNEGHSRDIPNRGMEIFESRNENFPKLVSEIIEIPLKEPRVSGSKLYKSFLNELPGLDLTKSFSISDHDFPDLGMEPISTLKLKSKNKPNTYNTRNVLESESTQEIEEANHSQEVKTENCSVGSQENATNVNNYDSESLKKDGEKTTSNAFPKSMRIKRASRSHYCINLFQTAQIHQKKTEKRTNLKPKPSNSHPSGNPLDSSKPKMNRGKHYLRDNVARRNKKKPTRTKKIIHNYRQIKNVTKKPSVPNVFLNKEFLELLQNQSNFHSDSEQFIFLYKHFTNKKTRNKVWDRMRICIENALERSKEIENIMTNERTEKEIEKLVGKELQSQDKSTRLVQENTKDNGKLLLEHNLESFNANNNSKCKTFYQIAEAVAKEDEVILANRQTLDVMNEIRKNKTKPKFKLNKESDPSISDENIAGCSKPRIEGKKNRNESLVKPVTDVANDELDLLDIVDVISKEDIEELHSAKLQIHSKTFRPYCNQMPSPDLSKLSIELIKQVVSFQERLFKSDPTKAACHRRYILGIKEVKKRLPVKNKVKILFIAPDLECVPLSGGIEDEVQNLLAMATIQGIPYVFSVPRRKLGHLTFKRSFISCLAILDYSGCESLVDQILPLIARARIHYDEVLNLTKCSTYTEKKHQA